MLAWLCATAFASAPAPMVVVDWSGEHATLEVWAPLDHEVARDAPVSVDVTIGDASVHWEALGAQLDTGVALGDVRDRSLSGQLQVSLCDKATGTCAQKDFAIEGFTTPKRKGRATLQVSAVAAADVHDDAEERHLPTYQTDAAAIAEAAFTAAKADGKRVLLDFGAVWCPPCNMLSAEVLHAADRPAELDAVHLAVIDVDDPRSNPIKGKYEVGGYPTLIVADAEGNEISRQVGYPGKQEFLDWLARAAAQESADTDFAMMDPADVSPEEAAEIVWMLVQKGDADAERWLDRASEADGRELRLARVSMNPNLDDAEWLLNNAPGTAIDWVYPAKSLAEDEAGRKVLRAALQADLSGVKGTDASDLLYLLAETATEQDQPLMYAASAAALRSAFTGDPIADRGHYTWLAVLMERSGDVDGAVAFLEAQAEAFPDEPTFYLSLAANHLRHERPEDALDAAEAALARSWGDNRLRAGEAVCKSLAALDRDDEAIERAKAILEEVPGVDDELKVRTNRYRSKLQAYVDGTAGEDAK